MGPSVKTVLTAAADKLQHLKDHHPFLEARRLLSAATSWSDAELLIFEDKTLSETQAATFFSWIERRALGEPFAYITQQKEFYGRSFFVDSRVLIPRPDTEILVEQVVHWTRDHKKSGTIVELGVGSGCIALTLALELGPSFQILGFDLSEAALEVAKENQKRLNVTNITLSQHDLKKGPPSDMVNKSVDVLVSNPPYISEKDYQEISSSIRDYEPRIALVGGVTGQEFYQPIRELWVPLIKTPGFLALETTHGQTIFEEF